jgi:hypothetical protein
MTGRIWLKIGKGTKKKWQSVFKKINKKRACLPTNLPACPPACQKPCASAERVILMLVK